MTQKAPFLILAFCLLLLAGCRSTSGSDQKFYGLGKSAKDSFNAGQYDEARKEAEELKSMIPIFKDNWNYGNAIQDSNVVLGRLALHDGKVEEAKAFLIAAGNSPGSPQMDSFGPNMSLAKDLLEKGERKVVLQYFDEVAKFWSSDTSSIDKWTEEVKAGKIPDFGPNLVY